MIANLHSRSTTKRRPKRKINEIKDNDVNVSNEQLIDKSVLLEMWESQEGWIITQASRCP